MNILCAIIGVFLTFSAVLGQGNLNSNSLDNKFTIELDTLTKVMLTKHHNADEIDAIHSRGKHLIRYNYLYSKSFRVKNGQTYSLEDFLKIDVLTFQKEYSDSENIEYFDQESGLILILDTKADAISKIGQENIMYEELIPFNQLYRKQ